ncbi:MAG: hypothetical protein KatS3mg087_0210 [Patescibacteria group bacterium]|nr:MAG: hypothetical protein KatS3mg087_0210 [Patescibacteria group bacterium]
MRYFPNLKTIQKNRRLILIYTGLSLLAFILLILWLFPITSSNQTNPLSPSGQQPTAPFSSANPEQGWDKVRLGISKNEFGKYFKMIEETPVGDNLLTVTYESNTPFSSHKVIYKDNSAVQIERYINERKEKILPEEFIKNFQRYEIIQVGVGNIRQIESYTINDNAYVIIEYDAVYKQTYKIIYLTADRYRIIRSNISAPHEYYSNDDAI